MLPNTAHTNLTLAAKNNKNETSATLHSTHPVWHWKTTYFRRYPLAKSPIRHLFAHKYTLPPLSHMRPDTAHTNLALTCDNAPPACTHHATVTWLKHDERLKEVLSWNSSHPNFMLLARNSLYYILPRLLPFVVVMAKPTDSTPLSHTELCNASLLTARVAFDRRVNLYGWAFSTLWLSDLLGYNPSLPKRQTMSRCHTHIKRNGKNPALACVKGFPPWVLKTWLSFDALPSFETFAYPGT